MTYPDLDPQDILPLSLKHSFWSWSAQAHVHPIPVVRAEGVYFWDAGGKRYLDFCSTIMSANIGHGDPRVVEAIAEQARRLAYAGPSWATAPRARLGQALAEITPGDLERFFFTLGGAEANENAVKIARAYTGRPKILTRYRSYHGATHGAAALSGDPRRWPWEPALMPGVVHFLDPYRYRSVFHPHPEDVDEESFCRAYLNHLEEIITLEGPETIAAVLLETVTGSNGVIVPPDGYLQGVRALCDRYGILLVCDEVMTGFGRTGAWFAVDHWGVTPDLMTVAKGLTSGYAPLGAVAIREPVAAYFDEVRYEGGLTYSGHPIALAAALANLRVMREDGLIERARDLGPAFSRHLGELKSRHPSVGDVRSIGLFGALELVRHPQTRAPMAPFNATSPEMETLRRDLLARGLYTFVRWHFVIVAPPLIITDAQLAEGFAALDAALEITDHAVLKN